MLHKSGHRRLIVGLLVCGLALAGVAYAYFTSSGTGNGQGSVGTATAFTVTVSSDNSGSLYPGAGSETLTYRVHNASSGGQNLSGVTASIAVVNTDIKQNGTEVVGCKAAWFTPVNTAPAPMPQNLAGGADSTQGSVAITMTDSGTNQDACQGAKPDVTVSAS